MVACAAELTCSGGGYVQSCKLAVSTSLSSILFLRGYVISGNLFNCDLVNPLNEAEQLRSLFSSASTTDYRTHMI